MHYQLVAKAADFTPEELKDKMLGFMPVSGERVHQFGDWKLSEHDDFAAFCKAEGLCEKDYGNLDEQDGILRQHGFAYGRDFKIYEKTFVHFDSFDFKEVKRYQDVISSPQGVYSPREKCVQKMKKVFSAKEIYLITLIPKKNNKNKVYLQLTKKQILGLMKRFWNYWILRHRREIFLTGRRTLN